MQLRSILINFTNLKISLLVNHDMDWGSSDVLNLSIEMIVR